MREFIQSPRWRSSNGTRLICLLVLIAGTVFGATSTGPGGKGPLAPEPYYGDIAAAFAARMPELHLEGYALDDMIAPRALGLFLNALDSDHSVFLASDIDKFRGHQKNLDDQLRAGDVSFAYEAFALFKERMSNRCDFVEKVLGQEIDVSTAEDYAWKRKDAPWSAGQAEWDDLWRKKIKDQYVRRLVSASLAEEKKKSEEKDKKVEGGKKPGEGDAKDGKIIKEPSPAEAIVKQYRQFLTVLNDNDADWVLQIYLSAFARAYDPHSDYMSASETENFDINMKLSLGGIGAVLTTEDGAAKVVRLVPGGPAARDGRLQPGDKIVGVAQG